MQVEPRAPQRYGHVGERELRLDPAWIRHDHGAALDDPSRLLEGDGKSMRHVKLAPGRRVDDDALESLVRAAYDDICLRLQRLA